MAGWRTARATAPRRRLASVLMVGLALLIVAACVSEAFALNADEAQAMYNKAQALAGELKYDDAIATYDEILRSFPGSPHIMFSLAFALQQSGKQERALQIYKDIESILLANKGQGLDAVYLNVGQILYTRSDVEGAVRYLGKAILANPSNADARQNLKTVLDFWDVRDKYAVKGPASALASVSVAGDDTYPMRTPERLFIKRRRFPEHKPQICVVGLTCRRLHLFERSFSNVLRHLENDEPEIRYEVAWVDNGSDKRQRAVLASRYEVEKWAVMEANFGLSYGINLAFFGLCRAKYILSFEEDWMWNTSVTGPFVRAAMDLLEADERLAVVKLKTVGNDHQLPMHQINPTGPFYFPTTAVPEGRVKYYLLCRDAASGKWKGPYSNGGSLIHRERLLREVGPQSEDVPDSEIDYIATIGRRRFCGAVMSLLPGCEGLHCGKAFVHIGESQSPGRFDVPRYGGNTVVFHSGEDPLSEAEPEGQGPLTAAPAS